MKTKKTNLTILGIISLLSLININNQLFNSNSLYINFLSIIISLIGISSLILYIRKNRKYSLLTLIWAYSQIIIFTKYIPDNTLNEFIEAPIWNVTQAFKAVIGFTFTTHSNNNYSLHFNIISLVFITLAHIVYSLSIIGSPIKLKSFKKESILNNILPANGTIINKMTIGKEKNWFVVQFGEPTSTKFALIKTKDGGRLKPKKQNQMVLMHYFEDSNKLTEVNPKFNLKEVDWAQIDK
jgi:hypothetical protein